MSEHVVTLSRRIMVIYTGSDIAKRRVRPSDPPKEKMVYITRSITARPLLMLRKWALTVSTDSPSPTTEVMLDVPSMAAKKAAGRRRARTLMKV